MVLGASVYQIIRVGESIFLPLRRAASSLTWYNGSSDSESYAGEQRIRRIR
jgi:hypothetical protein